MHDIDVVTLTYKQDFSIIQDNNNKSDRQILLGK
jgi:hypothetical protein